MKEDDKMLKSLFSEMKEKDKTLVLDDFDSFVRVKPSKRHLIKPWRLAAAILIVVFSSLFYRQWQPAQQAENVLLVIEESESMSTSSLRFPAESMDDWQSDTDQLIADF